MYTFAMCNRGTNSLLNRVINLRGTHRGVGGGGFRNKWAKITGGLKFHISGASIPKHKKKFENNNMLLINKELTTHFKL